MISYIEFDCPLGALRALADDAALRGLYFVGQKHMPGIGLGWQRQDGTPLFARLRAELNEYFAGTRQRFDLPLALAGTSFQQDIWRALQAIAFGTTLSYAELARRVGRPSSVRAVAAAVGRNPISLLVPCHRVIGSDGTLTGYAGGIERKRALLELEGARRTPLSLEGRGAGGEGAQCLGERPLPLSLALSRNGRGDAVIGVAPDELDGPKGGK